MVRSNSSDVLIVGAGKWIARLSALYAALLLARLGVSVHIIDKAISPSKTTDRRLVFLSPRSLRLLQEIELVNPILEQSTRHWKLETYTNNGNSTTSEPFQQQVKRIWESNTSQFNYGVACLYSHVRQVLQGALLEKYGIITSYAQELVQLLHTAPENMEGAGSNNVFYTFQDKHVTVADIKNSSNGRRTTWHSYIVIGSDGTESTVRKSLGILKEKLIKTPRNFYTANVSMKSTTFPGFNSIAFVNKGSSRLLFIGHKEKSTVVFQEKPEWNKLKADKSSALQEALKSYIKSVLEPYQVNGITIHRQRRWKADIWLSEAFSNTQVGCFLIGTAAQSIVPEELFAVNLGFDQAHNLCWKIHLYLNKQGSMQLLETYNSECQARVKDYRDAANALIDLGPDTERTSTHYILTEQRHWLVGETAYPPGLLFQTNGSNDKDNAQKCITRLMAPNANLKPYTAGQIYSQLVNTNKAVANRQDTQTRTQSTDTTPNSLSWRQRSQSETNLSNGSNSGWSSIRFMASPLFQNIGKSKANFRKASFVTLATADHSGSSANSNTSTTTDRWKIIKANQYSLLDRIAIDSSSGLFTAIVFCGQLEDTRDVQYLHQLSQYLASPHSFLHHDKFGHAPLFGRQSRVSSISSAYSLRFSLPKRTSSIGAMSTSSDGSSNGIDKLERTPSNRSLQYYDPVPMRSNSCGSVVMNEWTTRFENQAEKLLPDSSHTSLYARKHTPLFSFMYITSSTRQAVNGFLNSAAPSFIDTIFSFGLERVYIDHDFQCHLAYNIKSPSLIVLRPDGYVCAQARLSVTAELDAIRNFIDSFLAFPVDFDSAASDVADEYIYE